MDKTSWTKGINTDKPIVIGRPITGGSESIIWPGGFGCGDAGSFI